MPKEKKVKKTEIDNDVLNGEESAVEADNPATENLGSPTYEELVDINEELEKSVLRANADLDNALKRTVNEVEKAHKFRIYPPAKQAKPGNQDHPGYPGILI